MPVFDIFRYAQSESARRNIAAKRAIAERKAEERAKKAPAKPGKKSVRDRIIAFRRAMIADGRLPPPDLSEVVSG